MNKTILISIVSALIFSCKTTKNIEDQLYITSPQKPLDYDFSGKMNYGELSLIKTSYSWNEEEILIINYSQPKYNCHFDNSRITASSKKWWDKFYAKINTENCANIKVLSSTKFIESKLDNIYYFGDKHNFLYEHFFKRKKSCYGVLVVNTSGEYYQFNGHYSERQVASYIEALKAG